MMTVDYTHIASDEKAIRVHKWLPEGAPPRALLVVAHGMAEHGSRYARFATALAAEGWAVYAPDHRGHGETAAAGEIGWFAKRDGFRRVVLDLREIAQEAASEFQGVPLFLFGHSMGSILAEAYLGAYGASAPRLAGCVLSGVVEPPAPALLRAGRLLAGLGCLVKGQKAKAPLLDTMSFGSFGEAFKPLRTKFDWLSRDEAEVDRYVADPRCGFVCTDGFFRDLLSGFAFVYGRRVAAGGGGALAAVPGDLPVLILAGGADPCGGAHGFPDILASRLEAEGLSKVEKRIYKDARHELLNEINREEVTRDILAWLEARRKGFLAAPI
jgi:alpha-beta hydrolase superfamily lysophospholipase